MPTVALTGWETGFDPGEVSSHRQRQIHKLKDICRYTRKTTSGRSTGSLKLSIRLQRPNVARVDFLSSELTKIKKHYNSFNENQFKYEVTLR